MTDFKRTSVLRRLPPLDRCLYRAVPGLEGNVCAFELTEDEPITVEAESGRPMVIAPGDVFLGAPGHRDSTRWLVGGPPSGGLVPDNAYWVLAECGIVGDLMGDSPVEKSYLGQVKYLGTLRDQHDRDLNIRQFAVGAAAGATDRAAPTFLLVGTSAEAGKTTAGIAVLQSLRHQGHGTVVVLKATGVASLRELAIYRDFGAAEALDFLDFGLPSTCPANRTDIDGLFEHMLDVCLSMPADAVVMECGSDMLGANVPVFIDCLKRRRAEVKVILAAADPLAALGGKTVLDRMGLKVDLVTGPCTDTPTALERTRALCGVTALNMARRGTHDALI
ncbi:MAG TPA: hypothetical protein VEK73_04485 [Xanthobacteraceae bacterium]|nr:hypothetical protein [Xanthobacteraceae bacterium]